MVLHLNFPANAPQSLKEIVASGGNRSHVTGNHVKMAQHVWKEEASFSLNVSVKPDMEEKLASTSTVCFSLLICRGCHGTHPQSSYHSY